MTTTGPDFIALQVRDVGAAADFYEQQVGLLADLYRRLFLPRAEQSPPGAVAFDTEPAAFAVREPLVDLDAVEHLGWGIAVWMRCADADDLCEQLRAAGTPIAAEPDDSPFGRTFAFVDPDGYRVVMHDG